MSVYEKPIWQLLREYVNENQIQPGQVFTREAVFHWFNEHYPKIKDNSLQCHLVKLSTNCPSRAHYHVDPKGSDDLFYRLDPGHFRLFEAGKDPNPIYSHPLDKPVRRYSKSTIPHKRIKRSQWWEIRPFEQAKLLPILKVADIDAEAAFYQSLGFLTRLHAENLIAVMFNGDPVCGIQLAEGNTDPISPEQITWQFHIFNLKRFNKYLHDANIAIEKPFARRDWGQYSLTLRSPNGVMVVFVGK